MTATRRRRSARWPTTSSTAPDAVSTSVTPVVVDRTPPPKQRFNPLVKSVLGIPSTLSLSRPANTTVANPGTAVPRNVPTLAGVRSATAGTSQMALKVVPRAAQASKLTMVPVGAAPMTRLASGTVGAVANARPTPTSSARLASMTSGLVGSAGGRRRRAQGSDAQGSGRTRRDRARGRGRGHHVANRPAGEKPDTLTVAGGATRVICIAAGGQVLLDDVIGLAGQSSAVALPVASERVAVVALGSQAATAGHVPGWYAGQSLPSLGWGMALGGGAVVTAQGNRTRANRERADGGWVLGRELVTASLVVTVVHGRGRRDRDRGRRPARRGRRGEAVDAPGRCRAWPRCRREARCRRRSSSTARARSCCTR